MESAVVLVSPWPCLRWFAAPACKLAVPPTGAVPKRATPP